jgi:ATP-dependent helicase Lhr and Lhr-like helicase
VPSRRNSDPLLLFHPAVRGWFCDTFGDPTAAQREGWRTIARGDSTLIQAPTGSGKTLAAFLWAINRLVFDAVPSPASRCRIVYVSPLKALAVDIERNLRAPIAGITARAARDGVPHRSPLVAVRTGDTPQAERARFRRAPADILVTTPESLYLLLTSDARAALRSVHTVIVDEVHALVPTKRGAHLALSLERLECLCSCPLQRIGLSATQRPLEEVARYLGGADNQQAADRSRRSTRIRRPGADVAEADLHDEFADAHRSLRFRPVTIVNTGERKRLDLRIDVPVADMARLGDSSLPAGSRFVSSPARASIWTAIHPRLLELVRAHRSTLIFVNSRRAAERLAGALNDLAGEQLVRAHHGSIAREQRVEIEEALKNGYVRGLVATSSLELGIDMGAVDLVLQIESPPSVASGLQRVGRGGHHVHATSQAILFPKYRGDLLACAAVARAMHDGQVESTRYPRNPLDVLAQHIVAMTAMETWRVSELYDAVRRAAPFAGLSRGMFEGVLDMLSGRYPSDEFAELKPRVTWDRLADTLTAREGARRVAVVSGGTIPDRGLYGVFLAGAAPGAARVGELDEEMVFESRVGEAFVLGATTWRIEQITHDRVIVSPAPGEPGKMPFWKADAPGRPLEFGLRIGQLTRELRGMPATAGIARLTRHHDLDRPAAENLLRYLADQAAATGSVPDDRTIVVERCRDELGAWRVCVLSPLGSRVHAPWAMAVAAHMHATIGIVVETMWTDDGFVVRMPETDDPPDMALLVPSSAKAEHLVVSQLGSTAYFAARFREAAGRALLLPRRRPGVRAPLWQQRKRAADLLAVASRYGSFPIVLEAYRECLRDDFDMPALVSVLRRVEQRRLRLVTADTSVPSPFAGSLLFGYVANYLYDGDAPLAERRAHALTIDQSQLRELIGLADLRDLLDADELDEIERDLQALDGRRKARSADTAHDLLLHVGDLNRDEFTARSEGPAGSWLRQLLADRRVVDIVIGGDRRLVAVEYAAQYRDALGTPVPPDLPASLLAPVTAPMDELVMRYARTHGPFSVEDIAQRYGVEAMSIEAVVHRLAVRERVVEGSFRPGGTRREWCAPDVLRMARRRSLARLRHEASPVDTSALGRFITTWQGVGSGRRGLDTLLDVIEALQGAALPASVLESAILPARVEGYDPAGLDALAAAGEIVWLGVESVGPRDGRIALYLTDQVARLAPPFAGTGDRSSRNDLGERERAVIDALESGGASFFAPLHEAVGGGYPADTVNALWSLVWRSVVTNDTFQALRSYLRPPERGRHPRPTGITFRSRRLTPPSTEGRWALVPPRTASREAITDWAAAVTHQLLVRHGILTRDVVAHESVPGGFSALYPVLRQLEASGRIRRGYFVAGVAAAQFATPAAVDLLRTLRTPADEAVAVVLGAADPANPYGCALKWPEAPGHADRLAAFARVAGAMVILVDGALTAFWRAGSRDMCVLLPEAEPDRSRAARALAVTLARIAVTGEGPRGGLLIGVINGAPATQHPVAAFLIEGGFVSSSLGFHVPRRR